MKRRCALLLISAAILCAFGQTARASFIYQVCGGKAGLQAGVNVGYLGPGSAAIDFGSDHTGRNIAYSPKRLWTDAEQTETAAFTQIPAQTTAHSRSLFAFGRIKKPTPLDSVQYHIWGTAIAEDSRNHAGNLAAARTIGTNSFSFFTDEPLIAPGAEVGRLTMEALRNLKRYETLLRVDLFKDGKLLRRENPGSSGLAVSLFNGSHYEIRMVYSMLVPPRRNPKFDVTWRGTLEPLERKVPEPTCLALLLPGAAALLWRRPRRTAV